MTKYKTVYEAAGLLIVVAALFAWPAAALGHGISRMAPSRGTFVRPWIEGVNPRLENRLFTDVYHSLPSHNVLKVYVFDAGGYEAAGIRFSARVPHEQRDLTAVEIEREAVDLIRTTFEAFPDIQTVDVWGTIPIAPSQATRFESTVFSVSADRQTYAVLRTRTAVTDAAFLASFGRVWLAPQVPR